MFNGLKAPVRLRRVYWGWLQREPRVRSQVLEDHAFNMKSKGKERSSIPHLGLERRTSQATGLKEDGRAAEVEARKQSEQAGDKMAMASPRVVAAGSEKGPGGYPGEEFAGPLMARRICEWGKPSHIYQDHVYGGKKPILGGGHGWDRSLECRWGGQGRTETWEAPARGWCLQPWGERAYGGKQAGGSNREVHSTHWR